MGKVYLSGKPHVNGAIVQTVDNKKMNKYGNIRSVYKGRVFHSKREAEFARTLDMMRRATDPEQRVREIEYQPKYPLVVNGKKICTYIGDFNVTYESGKRTLFDVKGFKTDIYKMKKKLVEALYPVEIVEV